MIVIDNDHHDRLDGNDDAYHVGITWMLPTATTMMQYDLQLR